MSRKRTSPAVIDAALDYIEVELFQGRTLRAIFRDGKTPISRSVFYRVLSDDETIRNRIKKARRWSLEEHAECLARGETKGNPTMTIFLLKGAAPEGYAKPEMSMAQLNVAQDVPHIQRTKEEDEVFVKMLNNTVSNAKPAGQDLLESAVGLGYQSI